MLYSHFRIPTIFYYGSRDCDQGAIGVGHGRGPVQGGPVGIVSHSKKRVIQHLQKGKAGEACAYRCKKPK